MSKHVLLLILVCVFLSFPGASFAQDVEIQFGAFSIKVNAERMAEALQQQGLDVSVKEIKTEEMKSFHTVRSHPFASYGEAATHLENLKIKLPDSRFVLMNSGTLDKAIASDEAAEAPPPHQDDPPAAQADLPADTSDGETEAWAGSDQEGEGLWGEESEASWEDSKSRAQEEDRSEAMESESVLELKEEIDELKRQMKTILDAEDIRGDLEESDEEKTSKEENILNAAGRNYTLLKKGKIGLEYKLSYTYYEYDAIRELNLIEHNSNHTITNDFTVEYALRDNFTVNATLPFVYEYDEVGSDNSKHVTDFGDVSLGASFQPLKSGGRMPSLILGTTLTCPMGRNPYEINPDTELSTGSGGYSLGASASLSKSVDPIMAYGTLSYTYKHPIKDLDYKVGSYTLDRYDRGDSVGFSLGLGYALSYVTSMSFGYSYSHSFSSTRYYKEVSEPQDYKSRTSSSINLGTSWRLSQKMRFNLSLGMGLAGSDYFTISCRFPLEFDL